MADVIVPPINTKGLFRFSSPFDKIDKIGSNEELTVTGVRSLKEMYDSGEKPKETIYLTQNLTEKDYEADITNEVSIVVFKRTNNDYIYIPANRILSMPDVSGYKYRKMMLVFSLGSIPLDYDTGAAMANAEAAIYDALGIKTTGTELPAGVITLLTADENSAFLKLVKNRTVTTKSYRTLWKEQTEENAKLRATIANLEAYITNKA